MIFDMPGGPLLTTDGLASPAAARGDEIAVRLAQAPSAIGRAVAEARAEFLAPLGGDPFGPLVATGHQATLWHPGILSKYLVSSRLAETAGGTEIRLLVDQDVHPIGPLLLPRGRDVSALEVASIPFDEPHRDAPTGRRPRVIARRDADLRDCLPSVVRGAGEVLAAITAHADAADAASQVSGAIADLAAAWIPRREPIRASTILATPIGLALLDAIADDPAAAAGSFNAALALDPRAARPLAIDEARVEAPLWRISASRPRERVLLDLAATPSARREILRAEALAVPSLLAPRGLLLTGLVRLVVDHFIHGRGGWRYDRVTERWFESWLGARLAPISLVTADLRLPHGDAEGGEVDVVPSRRRWHDPFGAIDGSPSETKRSCLARIDGAPRRSPARRRAYLAMHQAIDRARRDRSVPDPREATRSAQIAARRDWAFPLYEPSAIDSLAEACASAVSEAVGRRQP